MPHIPLNEIIHAMLGCGSLEELVSTAGQHTANPLLLGDLSLHLLAFTPDDNIPDPRWQDLCKERVIPENLVNITQYAPALHTTTPSVSTDGTGLSIVRCPVVHDGKLTGHLLSPCYYAEPSGAELDLLQVLADLCAVRMKKEMHYAEYPENMPEYFISNLLNGSITDEQKIRDRCRYFGWRLTAPYRVLTIRGLDPRETEQGRGYLNQSRRCALLRERFPDATIFLYGEQIKFIIGVHDESTHERLILHQIEEYFQAHELVAGVSQLGRNFHSLAARHRQAMKAIQMGALLGGAGPLYYYDNYSVYHALELSSEKIDLRELCHTAVLKLEQYDRKNGTALMGTLHAYLASGKNVSEAASALYIHRNTLAKRLEKINDIITVDLEDREAVFHLLFSFRVIEYYGATEMRNSFENWVRKMPTLRHR